MHNSKTSNISSQLNKKSKQKEKPKEYAGIGTESIRIYNEQLLDMSQDSLQDLNQNVCNLLAEDINYKLRYIIHDCLIRAKLSGRDTVYSTDIDETFENLSIDKSYGSSSNPNWVVLPPGRILLDENTINLIEIAEEDLLYEQQGDVAIEKTWIKGEPIAKEEEVVISNYFITACQSVISNDREIRYMALKDISENPWIGPITKWLYHFAYFLLSKDTTYGCLTLRALKLVEVLENSPVSNENASEKHLKLFIRMLLQRLLSSTMTYEVLRSMCYVCSILCLREPLKQMTIMKIQQKINLRDHNLDLRILTIIYFLGIRVVKEIFLPNVEYFLSNLVDGNSSELTEVTLSIYSLICKSGLGHSESTNLFYKAFGMMIVPCWLPKGMHAEHSPHCINFVNLKKKLIKTRRKISYGIRTRKVHNIDDVFELENIFPEKMDMTGREYESKEVDTGAVSFKIKHYSRLCNVRNLKMPFTNRPQHAILGKINLSLLNELKNSPIKCLSWCYEHSLINYNL